MTTETTFEWEKDVDGAYTLHTPSNAILRCTLERDDLGYAELFFGADMENGDTIKKAWFVKEDDLDYLIGALTHIKKEVFQK